jgi:hypothetical protein
MAEAKREKLVRYTTPKGIALYPKIHKPDEYKGKTTYSTKLILPEGFKLFNNSTEKWEPAEAVFESLAKEKLAAVREELEQAISEAKGQKKVDLKEKLERLRLAKMPLKAEVDDDGEPTGNVLLNIKMNAFYLDKKTKEQKPLRPNVFDSAGEKVKKVPDIWTGSTLKVSFDLMPYLMDKEMEVGVSCRMAGVQIIKLVSGGGASAESMGFAKEDDEDGYAADNSGADEDDEEDDTADEEDPY